MIFYTMTDDKDGLKNAAEVLRLKLTNAKQGKETVFC